MAYPQRHLNRGETVAVDLHPHWWFFAEAVAALVVALALAVFVWVRVEGDGAVASATRLAVIAVLIVATVWVLVRLAKWVTTNFVVTSQRVIFRQGVVAKSGIEIPLERVNNVNFHQSMFERIIRAGDLLIESGGESGQQRFTDIRRPDDVQNLIHAQVDGALQRRAGGRLAADGHDVTLQLERLEGLLARGSITEEEFELQKRRLLG